MKKIKDLTAKEILNFTESECMEFLRENFGCFGIDGKGITREPENRTLENLRLECRAQWEHLMQKRENQAEFEVKITGSGTRKELVKDLEKLLSILRHENDSELNAYEVEYPALFMEVKEIEK